MQDPHENLLTNYSTVTGYNSNSQSNTNVVPVT